MSTSDNRIQVSSYTKGFLLASLFFAVFGAIYEFFSHQVYSLFMICAFLIPLVLGFLPFLVLQRKGIRTLPCHIAQIYTGGIMSFTLGSVMKGVLDIYGTTSGLIVFYPIAGTVLVLGAFLLALPERIRRQ